MIRFENVSFSYTDTPLITDLSFSFPSKGTIAVSGDSGHGKTTLLRLLIGLEQPRFGRIVRPNELTFSVVFQEHRLFPWLTVRENVAAFCASSQRVQDVLEIVGLWNSRDLYPKELSGGMQRRVALARAMAFDGDILVLDEPFTGLDEQIARRIAQALQQQYADRLIVLVTHSASEAAWFDAQILTF